MTVAKGRTRRAALGIGLSGGLAGVAGLPAPTIVRVDKP